MEYPMCLFHRTAKTNPYNTNDDDYVRFITAIPIGIIVASV